MLKIIKKLQEKGWEERLPLLHFLFMKIAEPRVVRLGHFAIYICMLIAGFQVLHAPSSRFESIIGSGLTMVFGGFIFLGAILAAAAVLPGIWWLERAGLIGLATGLGMYAILIMAMGSSGVGVSVALAFIIGFALRWFDIKDFQLAPSVPVPSKG